MNSNLFRKTALDKLSSPERLDQLMTVTPRRAWLALGAIAGILLAALIWSLFGSLPTRVSGPGIFVREGGAFQVVSKGEGSVIKLEAKVGDIVRKGQVIARLDLPELELRLNNARGRLQELEAEDRVSDDADEKNLKLTRSALEAQKTNLGKSAGDFAEQVRALTEQASIQADLQKRGLIPRSTLLATQTSLASARQSESNVEVEMANTETKLAESANAMREKDESRRMRVADAERELRQIEKQFDEAVNVRSPFEGRVVEVQSEEGDVVGRGKSVVALENLKESLHALLFIPAAEGKKVKPGMAAQIAPSIAKREEYGYMKGSVSSVSNLPATDAAAETILRNRRLVDQLFATGNPIIITVDLVPDPSTRSGYAWSTSHGPPTDISSGTLVDGQIVVLRQRPITLVLPYLRKLFGLD
jgi:HlyD family secretion protein